MPTTSLYWIDRKGDDLFAQHSASGLVSSLFEPIDPSPAIRQAFRLAHLLLLSNNINAAGALISALYRHGEAITPATKSSLPFPSLALQSLWQTQHPPPPQAAQFLKISTKNPLTPEAYLAVQQWGKYRECTRTGWMLQQCNLPEPTDPHVVWRTTDEPALLGMCARLLAKTTTPGTYPSQEDMCEALAAAKKLYALPQVPILEWLGYGMERKQKEARHCFLIYRRLAVELAIRVGEKDTAAQMIGMGLRLDGFNVINGGDVGDYLAVPGIWDVLPLLARSGKECNPFFIAEDEAEAIVREIVSAVELRARDGRQWSLAADKVGWRELLDRLAKGAWEAYHKEYKRMGVHCAEDILCSPATEKEIEAAEKKVGPLPVDFIEMIKIANGFRGGWHLFGGGIAGTEYISISNETLDNYVYDFVDLRKDARISGKMIELQAMSDTDGFHHYIIPPAIWKENVVGRQVKDGEYRYWQWAPWQGGISVFDSVRDWVASCVEKVEGIIKRGEKPVGYDDEDDDAESEDGEEGGSDEEEDGGVVAGKDEACAKEDTAGVDGDRRR